MDLDNLSLNEINSDEDDAFAEDANDKDDFTSDENGSSSSSSPSSFSSRGTLSSSAMGSPSNTNIAGLQMLAGTSGMNLAFCCRQPPKTTPFLNVRPQKIYGLAAPYNFVPNSLGLLEN